MTAQILLLLKSILEWFSKNHGKEIDVVCGEVAKSDEDSKGITDEEKLSRETKGSVDSILTLVETTAQAFGVQINGSTTVDRK